ncbi:hypothetical protein ACWG0Q_07715 [Actinacidiphila sp. SB3-2]
MAPSNAPYGRACWPAPRARGGWTPGVTTKSLIRDGAASPDDAAAWMLDTRLWPGSLAEYAEQLLAAAEVVLSDPRHFFRAYSASGFGRLLTTPTPRSVPAP